MVRFQKILVPLDGSPFAEQALEPALAMAKAASAELVLLRVTPPAQWMGDTIEVAWLDTETAVKHQEEAALYLAGVRAQLQDAQVPVTAITMSGSVVESIIDCAEDEKADLIVIASNGHSGLSRWLHGSVAEEVLHGTHCATLIIRGQGDSQGSQTMPTPDLSREMMAPH